MNVVEKSAATTPSESQSTNTVRQDPTVGPGRTIEDELPTLVSTRPMKILEIHDDELLLGLPCSAAYKAPRPFREGRDGLLNADESSRM